MKKLYLLIAVTLLTCAAAVGVGQKEEARHIDFTQVLKGIDGKPMMNPDIRDKPTPLTLSDVAVSAMEQMVQSDQATTGADKFKRDELARKIYNAKDVVLTVEEVALIKDRIGKVHPPIYVGAAWKLLDPAQK